MIVAVKGEKWDKVVDILLLFCSIGHEQHSFLINRIPRLGGNYALWTTRFEDLVVVIGQLIRDIWSPPSAAGHLVPAVRSRAKGRD
jgi:hypothetical protein